MPNKVFGSEGWILFSFPSPCCASVSFKGIAPMKAQRKTELCVRLAQCCKEEGAVFLELLEIVQADNIRE